MKLPIEKPSKQASSKCHLCPICDGTGCIGELPGMGGAYENDNCINNFSAWKKYIAQGPLPLIRLAPITGAIQNVGYDDEERFYYDLLKAALFADIGLSIGDGYPDEKLHYGIKALRTLNKKAAVFIKPYSNEKILERLSWASDVSEIFGIDIDSYAIKTMRDIVRLEKKNACQLREIQRHLTVPFAIKGVFSLEDIELVKEIKPDIVVISNHGGRVENGRGNTADFLAAYGKMLKNYTNEIWVDGGIRSYGDLSASGSLGASVVLLGRPCISGLLEFGEKGIAERVKDMMQLKILEESVCAT